MNIEKINVNGTVNDIKDVEDVLAEKDRAQAAEQLLQSNIATEVERAKAAEQQLQSKIAEESSRASAAEQQLQGNISAEVARAQAAEEVLRGLINTGGGVDLGSFDDASYFSKKLDDLTYDAAVTGKNIGFFRAKVKRRDAEVKNILLSSGLNVIVQVVEGTFVSVNNILRLTDRGYNVYTRKHENGAWSAWLKWNGAIEGGSGNVSDEQLAAIYAAINAEASRAQAAITNEANRAKTAEDKLRDGTTVRFDGVEKTTQNILPEHEGAFETSAQIIFYQPLKVFVYKVNGKYYHVGDALPNHMVNGVIRKDKAYLCNGDIYIFDGATLTPTTAAIAEELSTLRRQVNNIQPVEYSGNVTNAPDEEDLTSDVGNKLRLKDRMPFNGMGYVILRKEKTFAEQLTQDNTIYEVRYDFNLDGEEVTIPENCVLKFEGGSIKNGVIQGTHTYIKAESYNYIFKENLSLTGEFGNNKLDITWFGATSSLQDKNSLSRIDAKDSIQRALDVSCVGLSTLYIPKGAYYVSGGVTMTILKNIQLEGVSSGESLYNAVSHEDFQINSAIIFTDQDIPLLTIDILHPKYDSNIGNKDSIAISGGQFDVSLAVGNYSSSVITFSDNNKNTKFWGISVRTAIIAHSTLHRTDNNSCAIFFDLKNGGWCSMIRTNSLISYFNYGIKDSVFEDGSWITDLHDTSIISCRCAVQLNSMFSTRLEGSYQAVSVFPEGEDGPGIVEIYTQNHVVSAKIWDVDMMTASGKRTNRYAIIAGETSRFITLEGFCKSISSVKGEFKYNLKPFDISQNMLTKNIIKDVTYTCTGVVESVDQGYLFTQGGYQIPARVSFNDTVTDESEGELTVAITLTSTYNFTAIAFDLEPCNSGSVSFKEFELQLLLDDSISYSTTGFNYSRMGSGTTFDYLKVLRIPHESLRANKIILKFYKPCKIAYGSSNTALIYSIMATARNQKISYIDRSGRGATMLFNGVSDIPKIAFGNYSIEEISEMLPASHYAAINIDVKYAYVKNSTRWGVIAMRHPKLPESGGWGIPTQTIDDDYNFITTPYEDAKAGKTYYYRQHAWREFDNAKAGVNRSGVFSDKPSSDAIYIGFAYFCTDKNTSEGDTGIMIYHKGKDVWVDALGRIIS